MKKVKVNNIIIVLGLLIGIFVLIVSYFFIPFPHEIKRASFLFVALSGLAFMVLGIILIVLTFKKKIKRMLKVFLLLTGFSSAGILPSAILHNVVYGLFIYFFGKDFWGQNGDEAFFFILALIILPIVFLIGAVGSIVLLIRKKY